MIHCAKAGADSTDASVAAAIAIRRTLIWASVATIIHRTFVEVVAWVGGGSSGSRWRTTLRNEAN